MPCGCFADLALCALALLLLLCQLQLHALILLLLVQQLCAQRRYLRLHLRISAHRSQASLEHSRDLRLRQDDLSHPVNAQSGLVLLLIKDVVLATTVSSWHHL